MSRIGQPPTADQVDADQQGQAKGEVGGDQHLARRDQAALGDAQRAEALGGSAPRRKSNTSLAKLVPIWISSAAEQRRR